MGKRFFIFNKGEKVLDGGYKKNKGAIKSIKNAVKESKINDAFETQKFKDFKIKKK